MSFVINDIMLALEDAYYDVAIESEDFDYVEIVVSGDLDEMEVVEIIEENGGEVDQYFMPNDSTMKIGILI